MSLKYAFLIGIIILIVIFLPIYFLLNSTYLSLAFPTKADIVIDVFPIIYFIGSFTAMCNGIQKNIISRHNPLKKSHNSFKVFDGGKTGTLSKTAPIDEQLPLRVFQHLIFF